MIITVPILVLQTLSIQFQPALPRDKLSAISRVRMSNAVKVSPLHVLLSTSLPHCSSEIDHPTQELQETTLPARITRLISSDALHASAEAAALPGYVLLSLSLNVVQVILAFSEAFWPEGFFDVVCTDCFIPEFWVTSYASKAGSSTAVHCMTGFIAGKRAEDLSALRPSNIITNALNQLDQMFGEPHLHSTLHLSSHCEVQRSFSCNILLSRCKPCWQCLSSCTLVILHSVMSKNFAKLNPEDRKL